LWLRLLLALQGARIHRLRDRSWRGQEQRDGCRKGRAFL
jgi:hypothetical protein